jgi:hypothetical protein
MVLNGLGVKFVRKFSGCSPRKLVNLVKLVTPVGKILAAPMALSKNLLGGTEENREESRIAYLWTEILIGLEELLALASSSLDFLENLKQHKDDLDYRNYFASVTHCLIHGQLVCVPGTVLLLLGVLQLASGANGFIAHTMHESRLRYKRKHPINSSSNAEVKWNSISVESS